MVRIDKEREATIYQLMTKLHQKGINMPRWRAQKILAQQGGINQAFKAICEWQLKEVNKEAFKELMKKLQAILSQCRHKSQSNKELVDKRALLWLIKKLQKNDVVMTERRAGRIIARLHHTGVDRVSGVSRRKGDSSVSASSSVHMFASSGSSSTFIVVDTCRVTSS